MMIVEMREAAQERAFDLVDELHELGHHKKMVLCELEDALYDCFEDLDKESEESEEGTDLGFKKYRKYGMRNFEDEEKEYTPEKHRLMRMRRRRMRRSA